MTRLKSTSLSSNKSTQMNEVQSKVSLYAHITNKYKGG